MNTRAWVSSIATVYVFIFVLFVTFGPRLPLARCVLLGLGGLGLVILLFLVPGCMVPSLAPL